MSNISENEIESQIILIQENLHTAVANKDYILAADLQANLNKKKLELENEMKKKNVKLSFIDGTFPLASEIYSISYDSYKNYIEELETKYNENINVAMSFIGMIISKSALSGHSLVSFSADNEGTRVAFEDGYTVNFDSEWKKNALAKIESMQNGIQGKIKSMQTHPNLISSYTAEVENDRAIIDYFRTKISFIESLSLDDVILQSIKAIFASKKLLTILESRLVGMKYLVGEREIQMYPSKKWLVVSLWPTRNVNCKCTFLKSKFTNPDDVFLYQEDSRGYKLEYSYKFDHLVRDCREPILWLSDRIGKYREEE